MVRGFEKVSISQWYKDAENIIDTINYKNKSNILSIEKTYSDIKIPVRATKNSAGYDIFSPFDIKLHPGEIIKIPTGIKIYMQDSEFIMVVPRSSMGFKFFMRLANTVAIGDSDYYNNQENEGHYWIKIRNESEDMMEIKSGQAFAQAIFMPYLLADNDSSDAIRTGGLGSTSI